MVYKVVKMANKIINIVIYIALAFALLFCLYSIFDTALLYGRSSKNSVGYLKPDKDDPITSFNRLKEINEDVCAWITIDGTNIDYPVVRGENNAEYLNKDVYNNYSMSGALFLDYRNNTSFEDLHSVIFGHHMDGGAMFGDLRKFKEKDFFNKHKTGTLYTENKVYNFEIFSFIDTNAYDKYIYAINKDNTNKQKELIDYIKEKSLNYTDINLKESDIIVALSTCSAATTNGRDILLGRLSEKLGDD